MAWTNLSNALVGVGGRPFSSTIQALRDNFAAMGAGDAGSPSVLPNIGTYTVAGGIGTPVFARHTGGDVAFGALVAGSTLRPTSAARGWSGSGQVEATLGEGAALSGTWVCLGHFDATVTANAGGDNSGSVTLTGATLWQRIKI